MTPVNQTRERLFSEYLAALPAKSDMQPAVADWLSGIHGQLQNVHSLLYCLCAAADEAAQEQNERSDTRLVAQELPFALRAVDDILQRTIAELDRF